MTAKTRSADIPKIFRVTVEVSNIEEAASFHAKLLALDGERHPGARHYFDCGGVILSVLDPTHLTSPAEFFSPENVGKIFEAARTR